MSEIDQIGEECHWRDHYEPAGAYVWGRDYGNDIQRDLNKMAHTAGSSALQRDLLQRAFREIAHLRADNEALRAALKPFASGEEWGATLAWITNGAPTRAEGIARCKQLVEWKCAVDEALNGEQSGRGK